jgi:hypothetical protein
MSRTILLAVSIFLSAVSASALSVDMTPAIGDEAQYDTAVKFPDGHIESTKDTWRLSAFDPKTDKFKIEVLHVEDGKQSSSTRLILRKDLLLNYYDETVLTDCAQAGGKLEVVTVSAGKFKSCAMKFGASNEQTSWSTLVPFNHVKGKTVWADGSIAVQTLTSFLKK